MKSISELQKILDKELTSILCLRNPKSLYDPINYILGLGGKRIRPILMMLSYQIFDNDLAKVIKPALGIEIFHNFTLLHDDIMDNAPIRRGEPTVHEKWNLNAAILSGDTMLVQSYQMMAESPSSVLKKVLNIFSEAAVQVCEGQQYDIDFETQSHVQVNEYLKMIEYKTAVLLAASLKIGALIGGSSLKDANYLYDFGRNIGIAFQLKDDLLDIFGDQHKFGKQLGGDVIVNKKTYLYLQSLIDANQNQLNELNYWFSSKKVDVVDKVQAVKSIYFDLDIENKTNNKIQDYYKKAMHNLLQVSGDTILLEEVASMIMNRDS